MSDTAIVYPDVTVTLAGVADPVHVNGGDITLDSSAIPYGTAELELPLTDDTDLDPLDPRDDTRVLIHGRAGGHWDIGYTPWTTVRRNLARSPNGRTLDGFGTSGGALTKLELITNFPTTGTAVRATRIGAGNARLITILLGAGVPAGATVTLKMRTRSSLAGTTYTVSHRPDVSSATGAVTLGTYTTTTAAQTIELTGVQPAASGPNGGIAIVVTAAYTVPVTDDYTNVQVELVPAPLGSYFDGARADTATALYSWEGLPDDSPSTAAARGADPDAPPTWQPDPARVFDFGLRQRSIDHTKRTVALKLATDETLLQDWAALARDTGALPLQSSLRSIVNYALGKIGAALETGGPDADMTTYADSENLIPNGSFEVSPGTTGWISANSTLTWDSVWHAVGGFSMRMNLSAAASYAYHGPSPDGGGIRNGMQAGKTYTYAATFRIGATILSGTPAVSTDVRRLQAYVKAPSTGSGYVQYQSAQIPNVANTEQRLSVTFSVPADATEAFVRVMAGYPTGQMWVDAVSLRENKGIPTEDYAGYFDGSTPDTAGYDYSWSGTVGSSTSRRQALINRPPEMLVWEPGVSGWAFLEPLTTQAGYRLYCDERRDWRLIDPATFEVAGSITVSPLNATEGVDIISREDAEVFATGVVVRYVWTDLAGIARTGYDAAGDPSKVVTLEYARPYPGPGAAAAILRRRAGTGRTQEVTVLAVWSAIPGQIATITLPDAPDQNGKLIRARWACDDTALMELGTRGLIDVPVGSWIDWQPTDQQWQQVADAVTWESLP